MLKFTKEELKLFKKLDTPAQVQDFLNGIPFNFEHDGVDVIKSPIRVLRENNAHCIEGAILGAYILSLHGHKPLLLHLQTTTDDLDHVITLFKINNLWGALSKTNHSVLRYREPIYKNVRELVMSYFHEYFTYDGVKTLRRYSKPLNLNIFTDDWITAEDDLWGIDEELDNIKHYEVVPKSVLTKLRLADPIERRVAEVVDWPERK